MEFPLSVANYFINKSFDTGIEVTPMKVIKLVYISHGWTLGLGQGPLINEAVQAWKFGPVVESVYHEFKNFSNMQITCLGTITDTNQIITPTIIDVTKKAILDKVWEVYKNYSGLELSTLTHQAGTPWDIVWNKMGGSKTNAAIISNQIIEEHYKTKIKDNSTANA